MIVEQIMQQNVFSLKKTDTLKDAMRAMRTHKIRHIPIINDDNEVIGIVTDRDVKEASPSVFDHEAPRDDLERPLDEIMHHNVIVGHPLDFVEEVAALFYEHRFSCLPIAQEGKLVGIITETDLLYTLVQLTGAHQPGSQIEVKAPNRPGMLSEITALISSANTNIHSVLVYPDEDDMYKIIAFRIQTMNPMAAISNLKAKGYTVLWPNLPGIE